MTSNKNYFEQVGAFLDNELTGEELARFKEELAHNPDLVKELNFQKGLIEGIKHYRHQELKARLDNIPVGGGFWAGPAVKIISGAVIVAGIGFGIYELSKPDEKVDPSQSEEIRVVDESPVEDSEQITKEITPQESEESAVTDLPEESQPESGQTDDIEVETPTEIKTPDVPEPESFEMEDLSEEDLKIPESTLGTEGQTGDTDLEIEIISNKRKYPLHYQVIDGRLLLYGDFDEEPYELLEISSNDERKLFLFFKDEYYEIESDASEIRPLQRVSNQSLISELEKIKNKDS